MNTENGTLYVVATPIGNAQDITIRAIEILSAVDVVACEDTRETGNLLGMHSIEAKKLTAYHAHSSQHVEDSLLEELQGGATVALVTDRGTPLISDPGLRLVRRAIDEGITVVPIPGASAVIACLSAAGVATQSFWFRGFIPHKKGRETFLRTSLEHPETVVFYESSHRIVKCLEQLIDLGSGDRYIVVAREITKQYEEFLRGTASEILQALQNRPSVKGEFVVCIDAST